MHTKEPWELLRRTIWERALCPLVWNLEGVQRRGEKDSWKTCVRERLCKYKDKKGYFRAQEDISHSIHPPMWQPSALDPSVPHGRRQCLAHQHFHEVRDICGYVCWGKGKMKWVCMWGKCPLISVIARFIISRYTANTLPTLSLFMVTATLTTTTTTFIIPIFQMGNRGKEELSNFPPCDKVTGRAKIWIEAVRCQNHCS